MGLPDPGSDLARSRWQKKEIDGAPGGIIADQVAHGHPAEERYPYGVALLCYGRDYLFARRAIARAQVKERGIKLHARLRLERVRHVGNHRIADTFITQGIYEAGMGFALDGYYQYGVHEATAILLEWP